MVAAIGLVVLAACASTGEGEPQHAAADLTVNPSDMQKDFAFLTQSLLEIHPDAQRAQIHRLESKLEYPLPAELGGPELPLIWLETGLYAYADIHNQGDDEPFVRAGDQLVAIDAVPVDAATTILEQRILNTEPRPDTRAQPSKLFVSDVLLDLTGSNPPASSVGVTLLRGHDLVTTVLQRRSEDGHFVRRFSDPPQLRLSPSDTRLYPRQPYVFQTEPQVRILTSDSMGYIRIDSFTRSRPFDSALNKLFTAARDEELEAVVFDLRFCPGGDSRAVDAFGYSPPGGVHSVVNPVLSPEPLDDPSLQFDGQAYGLSSPWTASAANWFISLAKTHEWATVVEEPTGVVESGKYGNPVSLTHRYLA
jgi:hypothetical protein